MEPLSLPSPLWLPLLATTSALLLAVAAYYFSVGARRKANVLDRSDWRRFPLVRKLVVSPNTAVYRFALPGAADALGLPVGQHVSVMAEIDGKQIVRSYTPTSGDSDRGHFELMIKSYPTGNVSRMIGLLSVGDHVNVRGPKGNFLYRPNLVRRLGMIAGGTGLTPMLQIIRAVLANPRDTTHVSLIFANVNEEDILLRGELDTLVRQHANFRIYYVLNNPPQGWTGGVGFVTPDIIRDHCPAPADDMKILLCGPPPMIKALCEHCTALGYAKPRAVSKMDDQVFKF